MTWQKASPMPLAIWRGGSEKVVSGSRMEKRGKTDGWMKASFSRRARRLMTAAALASEPVAGSVRTAPIGRADFTWAAKVVRISHGSPA